MKLSESLCKVVFIIPPKVHLLDVNGPAHMFYEASAMGASLELEFLSLETSTRNITSSAGLGFGNLKDFRSVSLGSNDIIFIPGLDSTLLLGNTFLSSHHTFYSWLKKQYMGGAFICSVCTGIFLLAESGLLHNKECTTHWKFQALLKERYPQAIVLTNRLFVQSDRIYSSAGVASGIDLALYLLEQRYGPHFSSAIAREVVIYFRRGEHDPQLSIFLKYRNHLNDRIHDAQEWIIQHLNKKFTLDELGEQIGMSARNLTRLFKETTGITIGQYIEKLKVERAIQLLQDGKKVDTVAKACGLQSTNQLRSLLRNNEGLLPSDYKRMAE